jgi:MFS family permease
LISRFGNRRKEYKMDSSVLSVYRGLPAPIYVMFCATLINGVGAFVHPFLVLFLTQKLGYGDAYAGMFMTVATTLYVPGAFLGSKLADRFGRKRIMLAGQALASSMFVVCGFLGESKLVPLFIMLNLLFDGVCDPARNALQTDVTDKDNRQASFSLTYLGHNLGYVIGPLLAGFLFYRASQWLFWGNAIAGFIAVALVIWKVPESKPDAETIERSMESNAQDKAERGGVFKALLSRPHLLVFAFCQMFLYFAYAQTLFALPLYTSRLFGEYGATLYGTIMSLNATVVVVLTPFVVTMLRRFNPLANIVVAGIFYTVGFSLFGIAFTPWVFYVLAVIFTTGEVISATNVNFYIANNTPISHRARFSAVMPIIMGTGQAIAPLIGGAISEAYGIGWLWIIVGITAALGTSGICLLYVSDRRKRRRETSKKDRSTKTLHNSRY